MLPIVEGVPHPASSATPSAQCFPAVFFVASPGLYADGKDYSSPSAASKSHNLSALSDCSFCRRVPRFTARPATMLLFASCFGHASFVFALTLPSTPTASAVSPYQDIPEPLPQLNITEYGWPPEPFRTPLTNYKDGYLVFRNYGSSGSAEDKNVLLALLEMVAEANLVNPAGYPSKLFRVLNTLFLALLSVCKAILGMIRAWEI